MKRLLSILIFSALAAIGCKAQIPPAPALSCPASTGTAYTALNQSSPVAALTYTDTAAAGGSWCYIVQSTYQGGVSVPSNTTKPLAVPTGKNVVLSWTAPSSSTDPNAASYTYVVSRAAAISTTIGAPALGAPATAQLSPAPIPAPSASQLALNAPTGLRGAVMK